jgi:hypothetical protein
MVVAEVISNRLLESSMKGDLKSIRSETEDRAFLLATVFGLTP